MKLKLRLPRETIIIIRSLGDPTTIVNSIYEWYDKQGEIDIMSVPSVAAQSQECGWLTVDLTASLYYRLSDDLSPKDNRCSPVRLITYFVDNELFEEELFEQIVSKNKVQNNITTLGTAAYLPDLIAICNKIVSCNPDVKLLKIIQELLDYARQHT